MELDIFCINIRKGDMEFIVNFLQCMHKGDNIIRFRDLSSQSIDFIIGP